MKILNIIKKYIAEKQENVIDYFIWLILIIILGISTIDLIDFTVTILVIISMIIVMYLVFSIVSSIISDTRLSWKQYASLFALICGQRGQPSGQSHGGRVVNPPLRRMGNAPTKNHMDNVDNRVVSYGDAIPNQSIMKKDLIH